jgi:hypothetical protein
LDLLVPGKKKASVLTTIPGASTATRRLDTIPHGLKVIRVIQHITPHSRYSHRVHSSPIRDGYASIADQPKPRPLSAVAQKAYDRYGVLDPVKLDLMIRGIFITREDAAALPSRITADGCPDLNSVHSSHYQRLPRSQAARGAAVAAGLSAASSARCIDISANPSDHEKWLEGEVEILIRMRAENVGFKFIAVRLDLPPLLLPSLPDYLPPESTCGRLTMI